MSDCEQSTVEAPINRQSDDSPDTVAEPCPSVEAPSTNSQQETMCSAAASTMTAASSAKVEVLLKPVGDAPTLRQRKYKLDGSKTVLYVVNFIRTILKIPEGGDETVFVYVNQCFAPSLDQTIDNLRQCFASDGKLVLHYSKTQAWG